MSVEPAVVVTGVGLHTGHGDTAATWTALAENRSALTCAHAWGLHHGVPDERQAAAAFPAAPAPDPSPVALLADRKSVKYMGPCTQMAVLAAGRALADAGLLGAGHAAEREASALFVATGPIAFDVEQALAGFGAEGASDLLALQHEGLRRCHPLLPFKMLLNMPLGLVSIAFGIKGASLILYPGAEQGAWALAHALRGLRRGRWNRALVGASACGLALAPIVQLGRARRLAATVEAAQPFTERHAGWAPADQAAFLVLETEAEARRRGCLEYARLEQVSVLGADGCDRAWDAVTRAEEPQVLVGTGWFDAAEMSADKARVQARWASTPALASADGLLGVAPATSFVLATALACLSLRDGRLPPALAEDNQARAVARAMVTFHDAENAAAAMLSTLRAEGTA